MAEPHVWHIRYSSCKRVVFTVVQAIRDVLVGRTYAADVATWRIFSRFVADESVDIVGRESNQREARLELWVEKLRDVRASTFAAMLYSSTAFNATSVTVIIPAKVREYVFTGVSLSVSVCVCLWSW